jgi:hypothetical protein
MGISRWTGLLLLGAALGAPSCAPPPVQGIHPLERVIDSLSRLPGDPVAENEKFLVVSGLKSELPRRVAMVREAFAGENIQFPVTDSADTVMVSHALRVGVARLCVSGSPHVGARTFTGQPGRVSGWSWRDVAAAHQADERVGRLGGVAKARERRERARLPAPAREVGCSSSSATCPSSSPAPSSRCWAPGACSFLSTSGSGL